MGSWLRLIVMSTKLEYRVELIQLGIIEYRQIDYIYGMRKKKQ